MKHNSYSNVCKHSAKRIKILLDKSQLLSYALSKSAKQEDFPATHKCDHIKLSQILAAMDKLCSQDFQVSNLNCHEFLDKQRMSSLPMCNGVPLTSLDHGAVSTQCCVNQKHVNYFFLFKSNDPQDLLSQRHVQRRFREYLLACKQLKNIVHQAVPNARKYQIALLKDENSEEGTVKSIDWMPVKMEERHFRMGHTIKHPQ